MSEPSIIPVERYVQELWDRDATDLLLTAGAPPLMRIDGAITPVPGAAPLPPEDTERIVREPCWRASSGSGSPRPRDRLLVQLGGPGPLPRQCLPPAGLAWRSRCASSRTRSRRFDELGLPPVRRELGRPPPGPRPRDRADRRRQVDDLAAMIDRINTHRRVPHHHHRGPDRVRAPPQAGRGQPARDRHRHRVASPGRCARRSGRTPTCSSSARCATPRRSRPR